MLVAVLEADLSSIDRRVAVLHSLVSVSTAIDGLEIGCRGPIRAIIYCTMKLLVCCSPTLHVKRIEAVAVGGWRRYHVAKREVWLADRATQIPQVAQVTSVTHEGIGDMLWRLGGRDHHGVTVELLQCWSTMELESIPCEPSQSDS